jgi:hypothetical protein
MAAYRGRKMIEISVRATPGSNIQNAEVTVQGPGFRAALVVDAGAHASARVFPQTFPTTSLQLSVRSADREASVYANNIPVTSNVAILGINRDQFRGEIYHSIAAQLAPNCELRCTPTSSPISGPGCLDCNVGELQFKVCC